MKMPNLQRHAGKNADFFKYNNYNNHIINNKSDKSKILNLRIAARHWQWRLY
jgi:hypothetical protein